jgi:hypothetical protein
MNEGVVMRNNRWALVGLLTCGSCASAAGLDDAPSAEDGVAVSQQSVLLPATAALPPVGSQFSIHAEVDQSTGWQDHGDVDAAASCSAAGGSFWLQNTGSGFMWEYEIHGTVTVMTNFQRKTYGTTWDEEYISPGEQFEYPVHAVSGDNVVGCDATFTSKRIHPLP